MTYKKYKRTIVLLKVVIALFYCLLSANEAVGQSGLQLNASYKGDFARNFKGGIAPGATYLGLADLFVRFDTEKSGLWRNGEFLVHGANSHGGEPSATLIGDFQVASNIEAGNHTFLYELWYKQNLANLSVTIGLQDMNAEFANSEVAALFLNSSFGIHSVIADNIAAPIFPLTSHGITFCWKPSEKLSLKSALYKGCAIDFENNPYNIKWNLNYLKGLLWVSESQLTWPAEGENNVLKTGFFFHQHCTENELTSFENEQNILYDYGFYLVGNYKVSKLLNNNRSIDLFYQLGASPRNANFAYLGGGCSYTGLFSKHENDVLALAVAWGMLSNNRGRDEISLELTYKFQFTNFVYLQPDLQYIIHPGGTDQLLKNARVGFLRIGLEF